MAITVRYQYENRKGTDKFATKEDANRFIRWVASIGGETKPAWREVV